MSDTREAHEIIRSVYDAYRGLPAKLARLKNRSDELFSQHARPLRSVDPMQTGSPSPTTHFMTQCREFEAVERGAGRMLSARVAVALDAEFAENDLMSVTQSDLHVDVISQSCDVQKWLASFDLEKASRNELLGFEKECDEAVEAIMAAKARARVIRVKESAKARTNGMKVI